jgi:hypothetical protein
VVLLSAMPPASTWHWARLMRQLRGLKSRPIEALDTTLSRQPSRSAISRISSTSKPGASLLPVTSGG